MPEQYRPLTKSEIKQLRSNHAVVRTGRTCRLGHRSNAEFIKNVAIRRAGSASAIMSVSPPFIIILLTTKSATMLSSKMSACWPLTEKSSFGNGTRVTVINEAGGREVPIYDNLSAQIAALLALYRSHRPILLEKLYGLIDAYADFVSSDIGDHCGRQLRSKIPPRLSNVRIGPAAIIDGAARLENGTVNSIA